MKKKEEKLSISEMRRLEIKERERQRRAKLIAITIFLLAGLVYWIVTGYNYS